MSCHEIGRGLSNVTERIFQMYDEGRIPKEAMYDILEAVKSGTYFCDGNTGETLEYVNSNRCILCLKQNKSIDLVYQYSLSNNLDPEEITEELDEFLGQYEDYCVCKSCMKPILTRNGINAKRAKELMDESADF